MSYRLLQPARIIETAERLERRVAERFPEAGLTKVARELVSLSRDIAADADRLAAPIMILRVLTVIVAIAGLAILGSVATQLSFDRLSTGAFDFFQGLEATLNTLLLVGLGFITLVQTEMRLKRARVFKGLHGLRSLLHVIDMHQLTKDPATLSAAFQPTAHSPKRVLTPNDLARYLDYCSEMLSLTGKLAALYAQSVNESVVAEAVNDIEELGSNLSRKIWQKITMIEQIEARGG